MSIFRTRYRVVRDNYAGYESQYRWWWWPFWYQINGVNTHATLESAIKMCETNSVVWTDTQNKDASK